MRIEFMNLIIFEKVYKKDGERKREKKGNRGDFLYTCIHTNKA
jgi:hypothetical protein